MTQIWSDYVQFYFPHADEKKCHDILWGMTCFPFGRKATIKRQMQSLPRLIHQAKKRGVNNCDMCSKPTENKKDYCCPKCKKRLEQAA